MEERPGLLFSSPASAQSQGGAAPLLPRPAPLLAGLPVLSLSLLPGQNKGQTSGPACSFTEMVCNRVALGHIESPCLESPSLSNLVLHLLF